jgi:hypothetical protein
MVSPGYPPNLGDNCRRIRPWPESKDLKEGQHGDFSSNTAASKDWKIVTNTHKSPTADGRPFSENGLPSPIARSDSVENPWKTILNSC